MYTSSAKNYRRMVVNIDYYHVITTIHSLKSHNPVQSLIWKTCPVLGYLPLLTQMIRSAFEFSAREIGNFCQYSALRILS